MFGFKKKQPLAFEVLLEVASGEWTNVVARWADFEKRRPPGLCPIPSKFPQLQELFLECVAFHCAVLYLTALRSLDPGEADYLTSGAVQEISFNLHKYFGTGCDKSLLQKKILSRISELTSFKDFAPEMPPEDVTAWPSGEKFENSTTGQHWLATIGLFSLSKHSPKAMIIGLAGQASLIAAMKADLYQSLLQSFRKRDLHL